MRISDWSSDVCSSDLGDAREADDRPPELPAVQGVIEPQFERAARDPDRARGGLDARALEGAHKLLETLPFLAAEQRVGGHRHRVELQRIFEPPAIAEHRNLAAAHTGGGEGSGAGPDRKRTRPN